MTPALYVHIPFCQRKCNYCDFVSYAGKAGLIDEYVVALCNEIGFLLSTFNSQLSTLYLGGGTPTLLEPKHFEQLFSILYPLPSEVSTEANPGTADQAKLKALRQLGINRLSIGIQSFNDTHLKTLGRIHDAKQALKFYNDARAAGFDNINLDLMFALPGQSLADWKADLQKALELNPEHLSIYNLKIEEGTPFWSKYKQAPEDLEASMFEYTIDNLKAAGYHHYEISNFAKPGQECLHNINYWKNGNYLGAGAGAHSHWEGKRWSNPNCLEEYIKTEQRPPIIDQTSLQTQKQETLFLGLRLLDGIAKSNFAGYESEVAELMNDGLLEEKSGNYRLTRRGLMLGNLVFEKFV